MVNFSKLFNEFKINLKTKKNFFCTPASLVKYNLFKLLEVHGYVTKCFWLSLGSNHILIICFKYIGINKISLIKGINVLHKKNLILKTHVQFHVLNRQGLGIVSTVKGLMSSYRANSLNLGGVVICYIW